ncbi:uncharacterized protein BJ171DRAFT_570679 [Polychytrium aggregatum]|uniref:uncharacterized protein n=1 Tax=Polychytrium aggregatum TaxID=110093 RepID=UPI0022FDF549|nr:uncharacterized protein BJ171DRAFT_570679 [Polychytrium aggregatum]KAI9197446.1 hypothetical protein BJ171DRAFT_570679 [Polychytrium aggregatum]
MSAEKPRSMPTGQKNVLRPNDSASLWNCSLSQGWTREEANVLRNALIKYGIGNWKEIMECSVLADKTNAQLNLQTQRMLGQQSIGEFANLHIDPYTIGAINAQKTGDHIVRKNGFIINTGGKVSRKELLEKIQRNKELYELPKEEWDSIVIARKEEGPISVLDRKKRELREAEEELAQIKVRIAEIRERMSKHECSHKKIKLE